MRVSLVLHRARDDRPGETPRGTAPEEPQRLFGAAAEGPQAAPRDRPPSPNTPHSPLVSG